MIAKPRSSIKVKFIDICENLRRPGSHSRILSDAIRALREDDVDCNVHYLLKKPFLVQNLIDFIPKLEDPLNVEVLLVLLNVIWEKCQSAQNYIDPATLFVLNGPTGYRTVLMKWLVESPFAKWRTTTMKALKCLSEALENEIEAIWDDIDTPLAMIRNLFVMNLDGKLIQSLGNIKRTETTVIPGDLSHVIGLIRIETITLVNLCARANLELRSRITMEFRDKIMSLSTVALLQQFPDFARNCCLIWHNLCCEDVNNTVRLNQTNTILNATKSILANFDVRYSVRWAALLYIADVSELNVKTRLPSARDLVRLVYGILAQEYVQVDSVPVLACCKSLSRLTCSDDECKYELIDLLECTCKSKHVLLLMMVLKRWSEYENIVGYVLEICDNISLDNKSSLLLQQNKEDSYKPTLEEIAYKLGLNDHKIGYAARRLLMAIET